MIGGPLPQLGLSIDRSLRTPLPSAGPPAKLLIVDDEPSVASMLSQFVAADGYDIDVATDGESAIERLRSSPPDVAVVDIRMPGIDGVEVCRRLKSDPATRLIPVVLISGVASREERLAALAVGADDMVSKPVDADQFRIRVRSLTRAKKYTDDLESVGAVMMTLAMMIEARDGSPEGHCHRMANNAVALGHQLGLDGADLQTLRRGGYLHDIGMLAVPDSILHKPGMLEPEEYALVQSHTVVGDALLAELRSLQAVRAIVRHHHERLDGSGYPDKLKGDAIPLAAQIVGLVDAYESMTFPKPYQPIWSPDAALAVLHEQAAHGWRRPDLVSQFAEVIRSRAAAATTPPRPT